MIHNLLTLLYGDNGTNDALAWAATGGLLVFVLLTRLKTMARTHIGWGVMIAPVLAAIAGTIYAFIANRAGLSEGVPFGLAVLIFAVILWQFCRAIQKWRLVQIVLIFTAIILTITVGIDALINFWLSLNPASAPDTLGEVANVTAYMSVWFLGASIAAVFIAFCVVLIRGIVRKVQGASGSTP